MSVEDLQGNNLSNQTAAFHDQSCHSNSWCITQLKVYSKAITVKDADRLKQSIYFY